MEENTKNEIKKNELSELVYGVGKIYRVLKGHLGNGFDAHPTATSYMNGFLSTHDKIAIDQLLATNGTFGLYIAANEDFHERIQDSDYGFKSFYANLNAKNTPNDTLRGYYLKVNDGNDTTFIYGFGNNGQLYSTIYSINTNWKKWFLEQGFELETNGDNNSITSWEEQTLQAGYSGRIIAKRVKTNGMSSFGVYFDITVEKTLADGYSDIITTISEKCRPTYLPMEYNGTLYGYANNSNRPIPINVKYNQIGQIFITNVEGHSFANVKKINGSINAIA